MKTVLITGAGGPLGRELLTLLGQTNVASPRPRWRVLASSRQSVADGMLALDVCDRARVFDLVAQTRPDLILHLAATLSDDFDTAFALNVGGARNLCDAVLVSQHPSRLLLIGSAAEYGVVETTANPVPVSHPLRPVSVYGMTKAWQTMLGQLYASRGLDVVTARIFNMDGPGISEKLFAGRIRKQIAALKSGQQARLQVGPLGAIRDYVPLIAAAEQVLTIAEHGKSGAVYHVGSGRGISMRELLQGYLVQNGLDFSVVDEDSAHSNRKGYDVPAIFADMSGTLALQTAAGADAHRKP
jgi:GDP-4-dehydro-6-deoxy-D-mannose reductase